MMLVYVLIAVLVLCGVAAWLWLKDIDRIIDEIQSYLRKMTLCKNCKHAHVGKKTGAVICDWWRAQVEAEGWCYKGETK